MAAALSSSFTFAPPAINVLEIGPEWRRFATGWGFGLPEAKRPVKLRIWRTGAVIRARVGARSEKSRVLEGWGGRIPGLDTKLTERKFLAVWVGMVYYINTVIWVGCADLLLYFVSKIDHLLKETAFSGIYGMV